MAKNIFTYGYFSPKDEDGNFSLCTRESRIEEAVKLIETPEDYIELDDGIKCFNKDELIAAIEEHDGLTEKTN